MNHFYIASAFNVNALLSLTAILVTTITSARAAPVEGTAVPSLTQESKGQTTGDFSEAFMKGLQKAMLAFQERRLLEIPALLQGSLQASRAVGDKGGEAMSLLTLTQLYRMLGATSVADQHEKQAREALAAAGDQKAAVALMLTAFGLQRMGRGEAAMDYGQESLALSLRSKDIRVEGMARACVAYLHNARGERRIALDLFYQALRLQRTAKDHLAQAWTLQYLGWMYLGLGQPAQALPFFEEALPLHEIKTTDEQTSIYGVLSSVDQGQWGATKTLHGLALSYYANERPADAVAPLERAIKINEGRKANFSFPVLFALLGLGYRDTKQQDKAIATFERGVALSREVGNSRAEADNLAGLARIAEDKGQLDDALKGYEAAAQLMGPNTPMWIGVARIQRTQGQPKKAVQTLQNFLTAVERDREGLGGLTEAKVSFMSNNLDAYHRLVNLLIEQGEVATAWEWAEKTKSRALLDLMEGGRTITARGATEAEKKRLAELRAAADRLNAQLVAEQVQPGSDPKRIDALRTRLQNAERELQLYVDQVDAAHPDTRRSQKSKEEAARNLTPEGVMRFLPPDTALLNFVVANGQTTLFCATTTEGKVNVTSHPINVNSEELVELVSDFREACADPKGRYKLKAKSLYEVLLQPAATRFADKKRLILCPDGALWGLPFQALTGEDNKFLLERFEVIYSYSATALATTLSATSKERHNPPTETAQTSAQGLLVLANPEFGGPERFASISSDSQSTVIDPRAIVADARAIVADSRAIVADSRAIVASSRGVMDARGGFTALPGTQREADALRGTFPDATVRLGRAAREEVVKREAERFRYLHLATHGLFNDAAPMLSSIVLAKPETGSTEDGFLTARELFDLNLSADLVVLSACDTGRGQRRGGEGVIGLTWALSAAGVPSQVVSQWAVNDNSTADLMTTFYAGLKRDQLKGVALRAAALERMRDPNHAHPYYWAPFILMGDWR